MERASESGRERERVRGKERSEAPMSEAAVDKVFEDVTADQKRERRANRRSDQHDDRSFLPKHASPSTG